LAGGASASIATRSPTYFLALRSFAKSCPNRSAHAALTRRAVFLSGKIRQIGPSSHISTQSVGITDTRPGPSAPALRSDSSNASSASRAPARVQHPPTQNWTESFPLTREAFRQSLQSSAIAGPPQTVDRLPDGFPHCGQLAGARPYIGISRLTL
jgi:hypothetical protein